MAPTNGPPPTAAALITMLDKMRSDDKVRWKKRRGREREKRER